mmetsp:Transcript_88836/g.248662  ORF Transcript_88836/g.248662 Transcript_88836/m.248662 type:complete len:201 (-) Transcript_88836:605-1207(-)
MASPRRWSRKASCSAMSLDSAAKCFTWLCCSLCQSVYLSLASDNLVSACERFCFNFSMRDAKRSRPTPKARSRRFSSISKMPRVRAMDASSLFSASSRSVADVTAALSREAAKRTASSSLAASLVSSASLDFASASAFCARRLSCLAASSAALADCRFRTVLAKVALYSDFILDHRSTSVSDFARISLLCFKRDSPLAMR